MEKETVGEPPSITPEDLLLKTKELEKLWEKMRPFIAACVKAELESFEKNVDRMQEGFESRLIKSFDALGTESPLFKELTQYPERKDPCNT